MLKDRTSQIPYRSVRRALPQAGLDGVPALHEIFLTAAQTRSRYGNASDMWLWRRLHDHSGFPKPMTVNRRRLWKLSELEAWERAQVSPPAGQSASASEEG